MYGKADMTANVTYINGEETEREVVASVTLSQPVTEQQLRGTKERPTWYPTGSFGWPCNGSITSRFGYRNLNLRGASNYHRGIDIANRYGTSIYASDGGTVTYSGWMSGYGYLIIIDHGNGYQTYYGHNSSLVASKGAKGPQGTAYRPDGLHRHFQRQPLPLRYQAERHVRQPAELSVNRSAPAHRRGRRSFLRQGRTFPGLQNPKTMVQ